jgi:mono/diheme cytochrome c family protein
MAGVASGDGGEGARPIVSGFERFHAEAGKTDALGGRLLLGELNCASCHRGTDAPLAPVARKLAPILDRVGSRVQVEHLRAYLANPRQVKPGTTMPNVLTGLPKAEAEADVEALVHFLAGTGSTVAKAPSRRLVGAGRTLYTQAGCAACHGVPDDPSPALASSVPLGDVGGKYTAASLAAFLANPLECRPSGRMPSLNLKDVEAQSIASYLLKDVKFETPAWLAYHYYEGDWDKLPDLDKLTPVASGMAETFDVSPARRRDSYALRFEGTFEIDRPGNYQFFVSSDDGSRVSVDDKVVVDNDGIHPNSAKSGRVRLTKGRHKVVVEYFQGGGEAELDVEFEGPGVPRRPLASDLVPSDGAKPAPGEGKAPTRFVVDPAQADKGRALFASLGCASCHQLKEEEKAVDPRPASTPFAALKPDAGCLASEPPKGVPDYDLSPRQRAAIAAALVSPEPNPPGEREVVARTMLAFNCYTCHVRDGVGGVEEGRDSAFATTQKEMGDEGRIPPNLTGVGGKLTEAWLKHVLADAPKDRPYVLTRMPKFGEGNVGHLVQPLAKLDALEPVAVPGFDIPEKRVKATGRFLVGSQAFNCGSCHQFKEYQAAGIQALDMTMMTKRLRREWFTRYVVDPQAFRPGTRMPSAWPEGKSLLENVFEGSTPKQVESVWLYLSDGPNAAVPYGVGRDPIPLVADKTAVIYRNFIQGAGPRGIGVGYPEKANLAFDANDLRLALIWQGAFIDASKHWTGRGEGFQGPLGDNVLALPAGPSLTILPDEAAEWPRLKAKERGDKFKGYRLAEAGRPVFLYDVGSVHVEDFPEAVSGGEVPSLRRTIDLTSDQPAPGLTLRAATGRKIEPLGQDWFGVDGEWKVRVVGEAKAFVRQSGGKAELILPVKLDGGKARIVEEFAW